MGHSAGDGHHGFDFLKSRTVTEPVVSFDLFDTVIHRRYLSAFEVHETVSAYACAMLGRYGIDDPGALTSARYQTTDLMKASPQHGTQEPLIDDVWRRILGAAIDDRGSLAACVDQLVRFEIDLEKINLTVIPGALDLLDALKASGKTLIAISDMYFSDAAMREILEHLGALDRFDHVFISADHRLTKQTGDLFGHVCTALSASPGDVLHIGDNATSDHDMARAAGLNALLIAHHSPLERPNYGRRESIFREVADLNKLFLLDMALLSRSQRVEHLYFLARDGCLMAGVLDRLKGPIVDNLLGGIGHSEIFLNRSLTCWGGINFSRDWLLQAVSLAFWLNGGRASFSALLATLGVAVPDTIDPDEMLDSSVDTFRAVDAIANAELTAGVESAIRAKRADLKAYLTSIGLFEHRRVAFCDLGYSGSAVRDLNLFLVQEGAEAGRAPTGFFNVIASNDNFGPNSVAALPYVRFNPPVLLPSAALPGDLKRNFAWLELFFKHPTMQPITGFVDTDRGVMPDVRHAPRVEEQVPSEQVLAVADWSGEDIVLLWMASQRSFDRFTAPLVERFADPDADTVAQVAHAIYEADAVSGQTRSAVLVDPHLSEAELVDACVRQDFWIAGSQVASAAARADAADVVTVPKGGRPTRPPSWIERFRLGGPLAARDVDVDFYRSYYADLAPYDDAFLRRHYDEHGRQEGRLADATQLVRSLTSRYGALPADFDPYVYVSVHHDLREQLPHPLHGYEHYLKHGRAEGRRYAYADPEVEADFDRLLREGAIVLTGKERREAARKSIARIFCERHRVPFGGWIDLLIPAEFRVLNAQWAGAAHTKGECVKLFLENGFAAHAPLSIVSEFDPNHYRRLSAAARTLSDEDAYRHWLTTGFYLGLTPSEGFAVHGVIGETEFPSCFDWQGFAATDPALAGADRAAVLAAFARTSPIDAARFVRGGGSAQLLTVLGTRAAMGGHPGRAIGFLEAALAQGGDRALALHYLGDAYRASGQPQRALDAFARAVEEPAPNRWGFINGAELALEAKQVDRALHFIDRGRAPWNNLKAWRLVRDRVYGEAYGADIAAAIAAPDPRPALRAAAERAVSLVERDLPRTARRCDPAGPVVMLTGRPFHGPAAVERDGRPVLLFPLEAIDRAASMLFDASLLVIHDLPVDIRVLRLVLTAKALGIRAVYALGRLGTIDGIDLSALLWTDAGRIAEGPALPLSPLYRCAAFVFDAIVTRWAGVVPALSSCAAQTPVEHQAMAAPRSALASTATVLLAGGWRVDQATRQQAIDGLRGWAASRADAVVLVDASFDAAAARLALGCRVEPIDLQHHPDGLAMLMQGVGAVIEIAGDGDFSLVAEAAAIGVPGLAIENPSHGRSRRRGAATRPSFARLSAAIAELPAARPFAIGPAAPAPLPKANGADTGGGPATREPKILFVNVYFPPQSIGGATRVLKDNLDFFLDQGEAAERFAVITTDLDNPAAGEVQIDSYRGVRIYRLSTPQEIDMDWRAENAEVAALTRRILRHERPDLVHVHCVPRLSVSPVEECRKAGIPYLITLHDAWWISDYPFLTGRGGLPRDARADLVRQDHIARIGARRSWSRGFLLRGILSDARARLAVSPSFAEVYRNAGFECDVVENGVSPMPAPPRPPRTDARVNLCHVGGLEHHKGAYLLEIALKRLACRNLAVTVVDLAQETGYEQQLTWGTTPVRKIGRIPSDRIGELYAGMDILVAPSTWPESYGLVTREALKLGLWVIASDRGAIGDSVVPGENGFIVDPDTDDLVEILKVVDAKCEQFRTSPRMIPMRSSNEQAQELLRIYAAITGAADTPSPSDDSR